MGNRNIFNMGGTAAAAGPVILDKVKLREKNLTDTEIAEADLYQDRLINGFAEKVDSCHFIVSEQ